MKSYLRLLFCLSFVSFSAIGKIVPVNGRFFIEASGARQPIFLVNDAIDKGLVSKVKLFNGGRIHILSFAKEKGEEYLYSVDEKGFTYSIHPFSSYTVSDVDDDGKFRFQQVPGKKFFVDKNGFFLH
jgi:hypothetical protein